MDVFAGARLADVKQKLAYQVSGNVGPLPVEGRQGSLSAETKNWDAIVGARGRVMLGAERRWFVPWYVDVGAGDSDSTWQAMAGIGYSFGWGDVLAAYRYLDYDMKSGHPIADVNFSGPAVAVVFHW